LITCLKRLARLVAALIAACLTPMSATAAPDVATMREVVDAAIFELGSVSKTFTATLALYAQALGKMSPTDHPSKYMPQLKNRAIDKATVLNLGTYTAGGLPLQFPDSVFDDASKVRHFQNWKSGAQTGAQREYSNPSIGLFGYIASVSLRGKRDSCRVLRSRRNGARARMGAVPVPGLAGPSAPGQFKNHHLRAKRGEARFGATGRGPSLSLDRFDRRFRCLRGIRAAETNRHCDAGESQLPDS